ncbi:MAG: DUF120 domain-containing protein, partial [Candidatus Thalassarchaeaceae archaeon]|nr:DUF120 domain-containing protein [Candidatus Thalassarchaeaceae archaeon]
MNFSGAVSSGLGRAHVFMAQTHYQEQFKSILGSGAWPGTLNVDLDQEDLVKYQNLRVIAGLDEGEVVSGPEGIRIAGFE